MIATESPPQADLRPLGIVLNEQLFTMFLILPHRPALSAIFWYHNVICSFITNPYGRVHAVLVVIIHAAGRL